MSKIMLVEDDDSLREIYSIRLTAEGYTIVSARDGEEALAVAVRERPDLVVSDVMMPKISGFDMLDILRSTPETQDIKVIMMTALSSEDQRLRGESLGADRYLVKSQVGIEDVVNAVHEVLGDRGENGVIAPAPVIGVNSGAMNAPVDAGATMVANAGVAAMPVTPMPGAAGAAPGNAGVASTVAGPAPAGVAGVGGAAVPGVAGNAGISGGAETPMMPNVQNPGAGMA